MTDKHDSTPLTGAQESASSEVSDLVAFADCELIGINNTRMLVINRQNGNQKIMTTDVVDGLKTCTTFNTVEAHATHLAKTRAELQGNPQMAVTAIDSLKAEGMLSLSRDVCAELAQPVSRRLAPTRAFIITCDRPTAVERLLESMLQTGKLSQHNALFLVDDSRESANREANREAVVKFNLRSAKEMFYVGSEVQQTLLSALVTELPAHAEGVRFLLEPSLWRGKKTYGRSRTLCLLLSVGYRALIMDDDIVCQTILPPIKEEGVGIGSGGMRKAAFYGSEQELFNSGTLADFDPLSGHASLLGSTLSDALQKTNNGPLQESQLLKINAALAALLRADSPILVTQCGAMGDPGTAGAHWALFMGDDSVERLISAPHGITSAMENRLNWLGSARPNFYKMPFMSQLTGLDNSQLLPPYFPAFRGEDGLFGAMLIAMHRDSMVLEYPWSVPHLPVETRTVNAQDPIVVNGDMGLFSRYLTANIDYVDATDPQFNMDCIARDLLRMAARSDADLLLDFRAELARAHADQLHMLQDRLSRSEKFQSAQWQAYLRSGIEQVQRSLTVSQSLIQLSGSHENTTEQELLAQFRSMAQGFSAALTGWVETRRVAADLTDGLIDSRAMLPG